MLLLGGGGGGGRGTVYRVVGLASVVGPLAKNVLTICWYNANGLIMGNTCMIIIQSVCYDRHLLDSSENKHEANAR